MRRLRPRRDAIVISVLDSQERMSYRLPRFSGYRSVLSLEFEDTAEETKLADPGSWPDVPSDEEHARFCQGAGMRVPDMRDAEKIASFVDGHHRSDESLELLIHCHAGVSRSAAIAKWASTYTDVPLSSNCRCSTERANPRVLRLLARIDSGLSVLVARRPVALPH